MRWERLQPQSSLIQEEGQVRAEIAGPGRRWGHTCNTIEGGRLLYIFGGNDRFNNPTNQVHVFDTAMATWSEPMIRGTPPTPRESHSCTTVGDNLFVFGGTDGTNLLKDLCILDTNSHTWICPSIRGNGPEAREGHSAAIVGKRLFIFGGCGKSLCTSNDVRYEDLCILNTETFEWKCPSTFGTAPSGRSSHTCSSWNNKIIVIGGEEENFSCLSDVYILDTDTLVWKFVRTSGQLPPRAGHSTVAFGKKLFLFGGYNNNDTVYDDLHMLNTETGLWSEVKATGNGPSSRFCVAGASLDPLRDGVLVFIGGIDRHFNALNDMYYLHTGLVSENARDNQRQEKLSMKKRLILKFQEQYCPPSGHDETLFPSAIVPAPICGQTSGYATETITDGKLLHGVAFSSKKRPSRKAYKNPKRKRYAMAASATKLNDNSCSGNNENIEESGPQVPVNPNLSKAVSVKLDDDAGEESISATAKDAAIFVPNQDGVGTKNQRTRRPRKST